MSLIDKSVLMEFQHNAGTPLVYEAHRGSMSLIDFSLAIMSVSPYSSYD